MEDLAKKLREIRELRGFPQKQVAAMLGLHRPNYSKIENGNQNMSLKQLKMFCDFCDVSADYLLGVNSKNKKTFPLDTIEELNERIQQIKDVINK